MYVTLVRSSATMELCTNNGELVIRLYHADDIMLARVTVNSSHLRLVKGLISTVSRPSYDNVLTISQTLTQSSTTPSLHLSTRIYQRGYRLSQDGTLAITTKSFKVGTIRRKRQQGKCIAVLLKCTSVLHAD